MRSHFGLSAATPEALPRELPMDGPADLSAPVFVARRIIIPAIGADGSLFPIEKMEAHRQGQLHLAISAFVFAGDALLIQRRALSKYHCGGLWANTCCTHPHWGETPGAAAERRLAEELGLVVALREEGLVEYRAEVDNGLIEHERVHMFRADVDRDAIVPVPDPAEVCETRWIAPDVLRGEIAADPSRFTPWFRIYVERYPTLRF